MMEQRQNQEFSCPASLAGDVGRRLAVRRMTLSAFRNYAALELEVAGKNLVITGPNGSGKTNLLEAVSLLMPGRGLRGAKLEQLRHQPPAPPAAPQGDWGVAMEVETPQGHLRFGTGQLADQRDKRQCRLDGQTISPQSQLAHYFTVLWQTPQMDSLFTGGMGDRRRLFDRLTTSLQPDHPSQLARYDYVMRERNKLLSHPNWQANASWLDSLEHKMAESSVAIAAARVETWQHLQAAMEGLHDAFPKADITLQGMIEQGLAEGEQSALALEEGLAAQLQQSRAEDAQSGRSSAGAHRMELLVHHRPKGMEAAFCSTGEQKILLLGLLLAQTVALHRQKARLPILLLDEVIAHLDAPRRQALFTVLKELNVQACLTGTDAGLFKGFVEDAMWVQTPL
jgi:DNA replication and repair protein RecF